jgi:glutamyl-tRNA reductase
MKPGNWSLVVCGTNHKMSSLEEREPLQISTEDLAEANALFSSLSGVMESTIVATCNRIEFYFVTPRQTDPFGLVTEFYRKFRGLEIGSYRGLFHTGKDNKAVRHLFRVTAGIDSMVLGENQIMGQVKDAYRSACAVKSAGKVIHRLFHQAFRVGKQVRTRTEVGSGACSISTAAVQMLNDNLRPVEQPTVLFIGINQMVRLAARRIASINHCRLLFANRTRDKAATLAADFGAEGFGLDMLPELLVRADAVFSCTSSATPLINVQMMTEVVNQRENRRLVVVDLAIPRDVDIPGDWHPLVDTRNLEDIKQYVKNGQQQRESAIPHAETIIEHRLGEFDYWYGHVLHEPIYNGQSNTIESLREEELVAVLDKLPPELQNELNQATRRIVNRVIQITRRDTPQKSE